MSNTYDAYDEGSFFVAFLCYAILYRKKTRVIIRRIQNNKDISINLTVYSRNTDGKFDCCFLCNLLNH